MNPDDPNGGRPPPLLTGLSGWLDTFFVPFAGRALEPAERLFGEG